MNESALPPMQVDYEILNGLGGLKLRLTVALPPHVEPDIARELATGAAAGFHAAAKGVVECRNEHCRKLFAAPKRNVIYCSKRCQNQRRSRLHARSRAARKRAAL